MAAHQAPLSLGFSRDKRMLSSVLQARTLEWVAISFSNARKWKVKVKSLSHVWLIATPWTAAYQAPPSMRFSRQEYWSGVPLPSLHYRGLECKSRKSRNTWSNRQIWSWNTEWSWTKANRVLPGERTGHSKHPLLTTQEKILHMGITRWSTLKSDWLYSLQPKMEKLCSQQKKDWERTVFTDFGAQKNKVWHCFPIYFP